MDISFKVEGADEVLHAFKRAGDRAKPGGRRVVKEAAFALEKRIKNEMPVDTARARAGWGHWTQSDIVGDAPEAGAGDAHWEIQDDGLTIEQGTNVPYVAALNDGTSQQAPAGFIDKAVEMAQRVIIQEIERLLKELL